MNNDVATCRPFLNASKRSLLADGALPVSVILASIVGSYVFVDVRCEYLIEWVAGWFGWMDGWMDGRWVDGWMDGRWMDGWVDGRMRGSYSSQQTFSWPRGYLLRLEFFPLARRVPFFYLISRSLCVRNPSHPSACHVNISSVELVGSEKRSPLVAMVNQETSWSVVLCALPLGFLMSLLFFIDQAVVEGVVSYKENRWVGFQWIFC